MGTTVNNVHVRVGDGMSDAPNTIARAFTGRGFVTPAAQGWVTVFPEAENLGDDGPAIELSKELGLPCVSFFCFDSDVAVASLVVNGEVLDQLAISWPGYFQEMRGDPPSGQPVEGIESEMEVICALDVWLSTLGVGTRDQVIAAASSDPGSPFADQVATAVLGTFGVPPNRLLMAYRFFEQGEEPEELATFIRTG